MFLKRDALGEVLRGARYFPVVAILGPRQSGKTTLARMAFPEHAYVTLEDGDVRASAIADPRTFLEALPSKQGLIIDEFQRVPDLLSYIQTKVDNEKKKGYFILTGSQNFLMNEAISQSLAGRISIHTLLPLSIHELAENKVLPDSIETILFQGCYPSIYSEDTPPDLMYRNYIQTYLERDVHQLAHVGDLDTFRLFIQMCAARVGQLVNLSALSNECNISDTTVRRWLSILQASYLIFFLHPYRNSYGKRLVKAPKLYFYEPGLVSFLLKIKQEEMAVHPNKGNIFESFIIADILKWYHNHGRRPMLSFWNDKAGHEIDCIIEEGLQLIPLEIKSGRTAHERFFEGLEYWKTLPTKTQEQGFVIYGGSASQPKGSPQLLSWQSIDTLYKKL